MPKVDQGAFQAATSGVAEGFSRSIGGTFQRAGKYLILREAGKTPLTNEEYEKNFKGVFPYDPGMTQEEAEVRLHDYVEDGVRASEMEAHPKSAFAGSFIGSMSNPVDLALMAVAPEVKVASFAENTGKTGLNLLKMEAARVPLRRTLQDIANSAATNAVQMTAIEPFMFGADRWIGRKHGLDDTASNILAGIGMGLPIGISRAAWRAYSPSMRQSLARAAIKSSLNGEGLDPVVGALSSMDPEVHRAARLAVDAQEAASKAKDIPEDIAMADPDLEKAGFLDPSEVKAGLSSWLEKRKAFDEAQPTIDPATPKDEAKAVREANWRKLQEDYIAAARERIKAKNPTVEDKAIVKEWDGIDRQVKRANEERRAMRAHVTETAAHKPYEPRASYAERTKAFREAARAPKTDDELLLDEAFQRIFGTKVHYVDGDVAGDKGLLGLFNTDEPDRIYVRAGNLDDKGINMLRIAGHEMGHVIRARDPELWLGMVDTMLNPDIARHFSESWKEVRSAKKLSNLWGSMTYHERMDETLATVLGHAMQTPDFWVSLNKTSGVNGRKLAGYLLKVHDTMAQMLKDRLGLTGGAKVFLMEKQLAQAVSALNESGQYSFKSKKDIRDSWERSLNNNGQPLGSDQKPVIFSGYVERQKAFRAMEQRVYDDINAAGLKGEVSSPAARADSAVSALFQDLGDRLTDDSASPANTRLVSTYVKSVKGDPRNYLVKVFYKNLPDANAQKAFNTLLTRTAQQYSRNKDFLKTIMQQGPMATYKKVGTAADGTPQYEFKIYSNDKDPMWSEMRLPPKLEIDDMKMGLKDHYDELALAFAGEIAAKKKDGKLKGTVEDLRSDISFQEARDYLESLKPSEIRAMSVQDLIDGYYHHLDEEMDLALSRNDEKRYGGLLDIRNEDSGLLPPGDTGEKPRTLYQRVQEARQAAKNAFEIVNKKPWEEFDPEKNYHPPEIGEGDVSDLGLGGALDVLRSVMFSERMDMMKDNPDLQFIYERMSDAQKENYHESLRNEIDKAIYDVHPNLRRVMSEEIKNTLIGKKTTPYMEHGSDHILFGKESATDDSDWLNNAMEMPLEEALKSADQAVGERKKQSDAAVARSLALLDQQHEAYAPWLKDVGAEAQRDMPELLKRNNLIDFEVEDKPKKPGEEPVKAPERTVAEEKLLEKVGGLKKNMGHALKDLENLVTNTKRERGDKAPETDYTKERWELNLRLKQGNVAAAHQATTKDIKGYYIQKIRNAVIDHESSKNITARFRKSIKNGMSWLDGHARAGVRAAGMSVDAQRHAQAISDATPLDQVLARYGLRDYWVNNELVRPVIDYIEGKAPRTKEVQIIGDILKKTLDAQAGRINSLGGSYRLLDGFSHSQVHNGALISEGREAWSNYLLQNLDWERTQQIAGNIKDKQAYIDAIYDGLMERKDDGMTLDMEENGGNIMNQTALRRTLIFQPGKSFDYDMHYGSGDTGGHIFSEIQRRGEKIAIMEQMGPGYKKNFGDAMTSMGIQFKAKFSELQRANDTFHQIIGTWDNPVDKGLANMRKAVSNYMNGVSLWMTGISSITDVANIVSMARWAGVEPKDLHERVIQLMTRKAMHKEGREVLQGMGAGMQAITSAYSRIEGGGAFSKFAQKLSDFTMKYSGTEVSTRLYQEAAFDIMTQHLGDRAGKELTPEFGNWLDHYGMKEDWLKMQEYTKVVEGLEGRRLSPDLITDHKLSVKLRAALIDTISYGQLTPSVSNEAMVRMGTRAGTWSGEAMRLLSQYKAYPLAVVTKVHSRFNHAYGAVDAPLLGIIPQGRGGMERLAWSASMLSLVMLSLGIKDALHGVEPMNPLEPDQWTWGNATRVLAQAGAGPMATIEAFSNPRSALGPTFGTAYRLGSAVNSSSHNQGYQETEALFGALPMASLAPLTEARRQITASVISDAYGQGLMQARAFRHDQTGQELLLEFGERPKKNLASDKHHVKP